MAVPAIPLDVTVKCDVVWTVGRVLRVWDLILKFIKMFYENRGEPPQLQSAAAVLRYGVTENAKSIEVMRTEKGSPDKMITDSGIILRIQTLANIYFVGLGHWTGGCWLGLDPVELPELT